MAVRQELKADAVFEGGGVKGIGLVGAVAVAEEKGYHWVNVAGTSAGAIVATLLAAGYTAQGVVTILQWEFKMAFGHRRMIQSRYYMPSNFLYQRRCMKQRIEELAS